MAKHKRQYVRQMPRIYGNLQPKQRDIRKFVRIIPLLAWTMAGVGFVYVVLFSSLFKVQNVEVTGVVFSSAEYAKSQVPLGKSIWFLSKEHIAAKVLQDPVVESAAVLKGIPNTVKVVVHEREPGLRWKSDTTTVVLDTTGVAFLQFNELPPADTDSGRGLAALPEVRDLKKLPVPLDARITSTSFITFITTVQKELAKNLPEVTLDHFEVSDSTYDVTMVSTEGMQVQLNSLSDPGVQIRNLTRMVHQKKAGLNAKIDLRIDRWGYVQ